MNLDRIKAFRHTFYLSQFVRANGYSGWLPIASIRRTRFQKRIVIHQLTVNGVQWASSDVSDDCCLHILGRENVHRKITDVRSLIVAPLIRR